MPDPRYHTSRDDYLDACARRDQADQDAEAMAERQADIERDERAEHETRGLFDLGVNLMRGLMS
jgi:hypothetical protein